MAAHTQALLADLLPTSVSSTLRGGGPIVRSVTADRQLQLLPRVPLATTIADAVARDRPPFAIELLHPVTLREPATDLRIYNLLRAVSTLEGIPYYSISNGQDLPLFTLSHAVTSSQNRTPIVDLVVTTIPASATVYVVIEDSSFGRNLYQATYRHEPAAILLELENLTTMWYHGILPLIGRRAFHSYILVVPHQDGVLFYGVTAARTLDLAAVRSRAEASLRNRMSAMERWFVSAISDG